MAVYLGSAGIVQLTRVADSQFNSVLDSGDVDVVARRFSFDFPNGTFITGDRLAIKRLNADLSESTQPLDFAGTVYPDGLWYAHVDPIGGIRLYHEWNDAINGLQAKAIPLQLPSASYLIGVSVENQTPYCLGQVESYTLTTERSSIDITALGDSFRQFQSGLISGGGKIQCFWDWMPSVCKQNGGAAEYSHYMHQLILRQQLGSEFKANLFIKQDGARPINDELPGLAANTALFYEVTGLVTSVGMSFDSGEALQSEIEFVTTGEISLRYQVPAAFLILQEDRGRIGLEEGGGYLAQDE